jgi:CheY-like chemotaxis protein
MGRGLVMDDEGSVRFLAGEALAALGCEAVAAEDGAAAVALYGQALQRLADLFREYVPAFPCRLSFPAAGA